MTQHVAPSSVSACTSICLGSFLLSGMKDDNLLLAHPAGANHMGTPGSGGGGVKVTDDSHLIYKQGVS